MLFVFLIKSRYIFKPFEQFMIFKNDLFFFLQEIQVCNFADDTTFHASDLQLDSLLLSLEHDASLAIGLITII